VAIVCEDGSTLGWEAHDPHAVPFLVLAAALCLPDATSPTGASPSSEPGRSR